MALSWFQQLSAHPLSLLFLLCTSLLLLLIVKLYQRRRGLLKALHLFPGPPAHWLYGHKQFYPKKEFEMLGELITKYPCAMPLWSGPFMVFFLIYDPEYAKTLLSRKGAHVSFSISTSLSVSYGKAEDLSGMNEGQWFLFSSMYETNDPKTTLGHKFIESWVGQGLVTLSGPKWQQHRKILKFGFNISILKIFITMMSEHVEVMLDKWEKLTAQDPYLEISEHVSMMTLDSIMKCAFSHKGSVQKDSTLNFYLEATFNLSNLTFQRVHNILYHNDLIFKLTPEGQVFSKSNQAVHQYTEKIIQDREEMLKGEPKQDTTQKRYNDFLDILLSARSENRKDFSEEDVLAEVKTFMFAGHDTTSSAISWILYCMAKYPEHQQRCRDEVRELLGDGSSVTWEHLSQMPYTTMCIKECLRLYPPITSVARKLSEPITFPDGRSLPAGMSVFLNIWALHRNPTVWEDPQVFNPLRFSKENSEKRHSYAFLPFSAGHRNCIGQQFAMIECKVALALILLRFELAPDHSRPPIFTRQIVLKSKNGIHVLLKKIC